MTKLQKVKNLRNTTKMFRGVHLDITKVALNANPFRACMQVNNIRYSLGYHVTALEAAKAINKNAKLIFGSEKNAKKSGYWNIL